MSCCPTPPKHILFFSSVFQRASKFLFCSCLVKRFLCSFIFSQWRRSELRPMGDNETLSWCLGSWTSLSDRLGTVLVLLCRYCPFSAHHAVQILWKTHSPCWSQRKSLSLTLCSVYILLFPLLVIEMMQSDTLVVIQILNCVFWPKEMHSFSTSFFLQDEFLWWFCVHFFLSSSL